MTTVDAVLFLPTLLTAASDHCRCCSISADTSAGLNISDSMGRAEAGRRKKKENSWVITHHRAKPPADESANQRRPFQSSRDVIYGRSKKCPPDMTSFHAEAMMAAAAAAAAAE